MHHGVYWVVAAGIFLLCEMGHPGLFFFLTCFFAACAGAAASWLDYSITLQLAAAFIAAVVSFFALLRYKDALKPKNVYRSNVYALQGKQGIVIKPIYELTTGQVTVQGQVWSAKALNEEFIPQGAHVEVVQVIGCHLMVKTINNLSF